MSLAIENKPDRNGQYVDLLRKNMRSLLPHKFYYTTKQLRCQYFIIFCSSVWNKNLDFVNMTKIGGKYLHEYKENH
jgi:hypothetical protein